MISKLLWRLLLSLKNVTLLTELGISWYQLVEGWGFSLCMLWFYSLLLFSCVGSRGWALDTTRHPGVHPDHEGAHSFCRLPWRVQEVHSKEEEGLGKVGGLTQRYYTLGYCVIRFGWSCTIEWVWWWVGGDWIIVLIPTCVLPQYICMLHILYHYGSVCLSLLFYHNQRIIWLVLQHR